MGINISQLAPSPKSFRKIITKYASYQSQNLGEINAVLRLTSLWIRVVSYDFIEGVGYLVIFYFNPITTKGPANPMGKKPTLWIFQNKKDVLRMVNQHSVGSFYVEELSIKENIAGRGGNNLGFGPYIPISWNDMFQLMISYKQNMQEALDSMTEIANTNTKSDEMINKLNKMNNRNMTLRKQLTDPSPRNMKNAYDEAMRGMRKGKDIASFAIAGFTNPFKLVRKIGKSVVKKQARKNVVKPIVDKTKPHFIQAVGFENIDRINQGKQLLDKGKEINSYARKPVNKITKKGLNKAKHELEEIARKATKY